MAGPRNESGGFRPSTGRTAGDARNKSGHDGAGGTGMTGRGGRASRGGGTGMTGRGRRDGRGGHAAKGSRTITVSSRSGLVESSATGASISSSTRRMYFTASAGSPAQLRAPRVLADQPASDS